MKIEILAEKIDALIRLIDDLEQKHDDLAADKQAWLTERAYLLEKNAQAKTKITAMLMRLRSLE